VMFTPALDDAQELGMLSQKLHEIVRRTTLYDTVGEFIFGL
jgi:hypothetical protein